METTNNQLLESINNSFQKISDELARPKEDIVGMSVCGITKNTIGNLLRLYLNGRNIQVRDGESTNEMMKTCIAENKDFAQFDLSPLACRCDPSNDSMSYCIGEESIYSCFKLLESIKKFVYGELKISALQN